MEDLEVGCRISNEGGLLRNGQRWGWVGRQGWLWWTFLTEETLFWMCCESLKVFKQRSGRFRVMFQKMALSDRWGLSWGRLVIAWSQWRLLEVF